MSVLHAKSKEEFAYYFPHYAVTK